MDDDKSNGKKTNGHSTIKFNDEGEHHSRFQVGTVDTPDDESQNKCKSILI